MSTIRKTPPLDGVGLGRRRKPFDPVAFAISAFGVLLFVGFLFGIDELFRQPRENHLEAQLAAAGYPGAQLQRQWMAWCWGKNEDHYAWRTATAHGAACAKTASATIWVDGPKGRERL